MNREFTPASSSTRTKTTAVQVAGTARGGDLEEQYNAALAWLERLDAPVIAAPTVREGQGFTNYVPNNDLDAVGGDPRRVSEIRAGKNIRSLIFDASVPLLYVWTFDSGEDIRSS